MPGPFVHSIDPVITEFGGVYLWFYGLSYTLGFAELHWWISRNRPRLGLGLEESYRLSLSFSLGVLTGGRLIEIFLYEWPFYRTHLLLAPALWLGGMATHGLLLGAIAGTFFFCRAHGRSFLELADELVIPGAFLMGVGRLGNFIDGQIVGRIVGSMSEVWWAVKFPDAEGFRHPVVLYDGLKNLALIPWLLVVRKRTGRGLATAHFIFWYAFLRIFVDLFREYPTSLWGVATGQVLNLAMAAIGALLILRFQGASPANSELPSARSDSIDHRGLFLLRAGFAAVLIFCLTIPSDSTQDIPLRYGKRHPGLAYSALYPRIR